MAREKKEKKRRGRHSEGTADGAGQEQSRAPEAVGRQVYPPAAQPDPEQSAYPPGAHLPQQPYPPTPGTPLPEQPFAPPEPYGQAAQTGAPVEGAAPQYQAGPEPSPFVPAAQEPAQAGLPANEQQAPAPPAAPGGGLYQQPPTPVPEGPPTVTPADPPAVEAGAGRSPWEETPLEEMLANEPPPPQEPPDGTGPPPPPEPPLPTGQMPPPAAGEQPPFAGPMTPPTGGYYFPPPWYPSPYAMPGPYFAYPQPGQTGPIPTVPPGQMPPLPGGFPVPLYGPDMPMPPLMLGSLEEPEFESLTHVETSHWRGDFKWTFGILTAFFIFLSLLSAGAYRATGPGAAKQVLIRVMDATQVKKFVRDNYQELRAKARRSTSTKIYIPDIGISVSIEGAVIASSSPDDLAERVVLEAARQIYSQGYRQDLPMKAAQGPAEERAKAIIATLLSKMNKNQHSALIWPVIIFGILALAFGILLLVFCKGWGKAIGAGLAIIAAALPGSFMLRVGNQFIWKPTASGTFRPAANQALRTIGSMSISFFDIALAFGALVLLVGVIGAVIARKSRERITPFTQLKRPGEAVAGGPAVEPGMEKDIDGSRIPDDSESFFLN
jgi:hypothetical protein